MIKPLQYLVFTILTISASTAFAGNPTQVDIPSQTMPQVVPNPQAEDYQQKQKRIEEKNLIEVRQEHAKSATHAVQEGSTIRLY